MRPLRQRQPGCRRMPDAPGRSQPLQWAAAITEMGCGLRSFASNELPQKICCQPAAAAASL